MKKDLKALGSLNQKYVLSLIMDMFPKQYQCYNCKSTASVIQKCEYAKPWLTHHSCNCQKLNLFPHPKYSGYENLLTFKLTHEWQWLFFRKNTYSLPPLQHKLYVFNSSNNITPDSNEWDHIVLNNGHPDSIASFDYIPSFVFFPTEKAIERLEIISIFK